MFQNRGRDIVPQLTITPGDTSPEQTCASAGVPQPDITGPTNTATRPVTVLEVHTLNR